MNKAPPRSTTRTTDAYILYSDKWWHHYIDYVQQQSTVKKNEFIWLHVVGEIILSMHA